MRRRTRATKKSRRSADRMNNESLTLTRARLFVAAARVVYFACKLWHDLTN